MSYMERLEGKLSKYTNVMKGWQNRYFMLNPQNGSLEYHVSQAEAISCTGKPRGSIFLAGAVIAPSIDDEHTFSVNATNGEVYKLRGTNTKERQEWVSHLRAVAHHFTTQIAQEHPPLANLRKSRTASIKSQLNTNLNKIKDQVQHISTTANAPGSQTGNSAAIESSSDENHPAASALQPTNRPRTDSQTSFGNFPRLTDSAKTLPKSGLKELQDVREMIVSADNYHAGLVNTLESVHRHSDAINSTSDLVSVNSNDDWRSVSSFAFDRDVLLMKATSLAMLQSLSSAYSILHKYYQSSISALPQNAAISWVEPRTSTSPTPKRKTKDSVNEYTGAAVFEVPTLANANEEVMDSPAKEEEDLGPVDEYKNAIMELLSQVKLGMDLTKVTLPTFILEKRSLLEMYADFLGHSHLFLAISDGMSPEDRMCRVIKFYLSGFHNGRKGHVTKKPYNPVAGEVFQCSYHVRTQPTPPSHASAPSAGTHHHRIKFLAEQVSHHPPVSAFCASCPEKQMLFHSTVWTKSRFMNMSIGVNNIGEGVLSLQRVNENYVMNYPSAYARSILTVPWIELGGRCTITCDNTGLSATITFHTKPTYGGQSDRISVEARTGNGFVFCRGDGNWNEAVEFTYYVQPKGGNADAAEVKVLTEMFDLTKLAACTKYVRPLEKQGRMESRNIWLQVTESLRNGDVATATKNKLALEKQQRELEKQREDDARPLIPHFFTVSKGKESEVYLPNNSIV